MGFDLHIAVAPSPTPSTPRSGAGAVAIVSIEVNGTFTQAGRVALARAVARSFHGGAETVFVELQEVVVREPVALAGFADDLMAERSAGRQVQVVARDEALHAACAAIAHSEDWLIASTAADLSVGRRSVHVEGTE